MAYKHVRIIDNDLNKYLKVFEDKYIGFHIEFILEPFTNTFDIFYTYFCYRDLGDE